MENRISGLYIDIGFLWEEDILKQVIQAPLVEDDGIVDLLASAEGGVMPVSVSFGEMIVSGNPTDVPVSHTRKFLQKDEQDVSSVLDFIVPHNN